MGSLYVEFIKSLEKITCDYYRDIAVNGLDDRDGFKENVMGLQRNLWGKIYWEGRPAPEFDLGYFLMECRKRFKVVFLFDEFDGYLGLVGGHVAYHEERKINQYGHEMDLRYMVVDNMYGNIYRGWYEDEFFVGGWSPYGAIIQVRGYGEYEPYRAWSLISRREKFEKWKKESYEKMAAEDSIAKASPYQFTPGLSEVIKIRCYKEIYDSVCDEKLSMEENKFRFVAKSRKEIINLGVFCHEGRHNLEMKIGKRYPRVDSEFHAKLSQVYFTDYPFLGLLNGIIDPMTELDNDFGNANKKVIDGLIAWMKKNSDSIKGFNKAKAVFPQILLLSDGQLKEAIASMDPLAP